MARPGRKQVTWKVDRKAHVELPIGSYIPDAEVPPEHMELLEGKLELGALFFILRPMAQEKNPYVKPNQHPYIQESWYTDSYPVNSLAVYAGTVRVEESKGGSVFRTLRHSFIIGGVRYLTRNLNLFKPAD